MFTVPGYDVVELLGFGATGEVWLGRELASGDAVALKRLRSPQDLAGRDRLRREAAALAGLTHPHVVRLRTLLSAGDDLVLVLDHAPGGSLARLTAIRRMLTPGEVVTVAVPLAQALATAHARGLVHGDVTPANVLFTADGRPLLSDLGVSRLVGEPPGDVEGTLGFVDPAVVAGATPSPASDVFGLAAVCWAALTGHPPGAAAGRSPGGGPADRLPVRASPPDVPAALVHAIETGLDADPQRRPPAGQFAVTVFDACPAEPVRLPAWPAEASGEGAPAPGAGPPSLAASAPDAGMAALRPAPEPPPVLTHRVRPAVPADPVPGEAERRRRVGTRRGVVQRPVGGLRWRPLAAGLLGLTGLVMAVLTGVVWAGTGGREPPSEVGAGSDGRETRRGQAPADGPGPAAGAPGPATSATQAPTRAAAVSRAVDWATVLRGLDARRSAAFASADPGALTRVYAPGAPALGRDRAVLDRLAAAGVHTRGLRLEPSSVVVRTAGDRRTVLEVVDVLPPYDLVSGDGSLVDARPGRRKTRWTLTLARVGSSWRVYDVVRAS